MRTYILDVTTVFKPVKYHYEFDQLDWVVMIIVL